MSSESSTDRSAPGGRSDTGIQPWHLYLLLSMAAATWAVLVSPHTHPAALALLSAAIIGAGVVGAAMHNAIAGFFGLTPREPVLSASVREALEHDKALVLRSIKELEFDRAMGKVSDADFADVSTRLRARAVALIAALDRAPAEDTGSLKTPGVDHGRRPDSGVSAAETPEDTGSLKTPGVVRCGGCGTGNDEDARFCKSCGEKLS